MRLIGILAFFLLPVIGQQKVSRDISQEREAAIGKALAENFRSQTPSVDDAALRAYVTKVAARLNEFAHSRFPLTIEIYGGSDSKLEPVGLPGGYLFVPLKLLTEAQIEAELAAPVAHAIAHIVTWQGTPIQTGNVTSVPLIFMGAWAHDHVADSTLMPLSSRKFQKEQEAEATGLAAVWMAQRGLANQAFQPGEFATAHERALAIATAEIRVPRPPSLRERQR